MVDQLISAVITNYNYEKYISETVKSLVAQEYKDLELIVVDDGSTDNSKEIIESLKKEYPGRFHRFVTEYLPKNKGINGALNVAIPYVEGEFALIVDADDVLDAQHIAKLIKSLRREHEQDRSIAFAYCDCNLIDEDGQMIQRGLSKPFSSELIERESFLPRPSLIISSVLKTFFPLPEYSLEDPKHALWKRICKAGNKGAYVHEPLFLYRVHSKNFSHIGKKIQAAQESGLAEQPLYLSDYWPNS